MQLCPKCSRRYDDDVRFCPHDGTLAAPVDPLVGTVLDGKYRLETLLGTGGMGAVYRATQFALSRPVAIKVIRGRFPVDSVQTQRFKREALTVAQLRHPHIVTIHDFGISDGVGAYLVMELLEGRSVREEIARRGRLPPDLASEILRQTCAAIHVAHGAGIVHRDLKPDNIFLELARGALPSEAPFVAKVLDFGVAKLGLQLDGSYGSLTQPGALVGTPAYTAPEQLAGEAVDGRADVYSLGCVAYEMLVGRPPFLAETLRAIITKHMLEDPVPLRDLDPDIPESVEAAVLRALAKRPADRFPTAATFARALAEYGGSGLSVTLAAEPPELRLTAVPWAQNTGLRMSRDTAVVEPSAARRRNNNLPEPLTSFVPRDEERSAVERLLTQARLVTVTGAGGMGKTRLALEVARSVKEGYSDGAWLVEFAALSDPELVAGAIGAVFGLKPEPERSATTSLEDYFAGKQLILVFDNCEHVVDACSRMADAILRASPDVRILATSQETLGVLGEAVYRLPSMSLPAPAASPTAEEASRYDSVRLFVDRARLADPAFDLSAATAARVVEICRRLDGIPLAIELAASRVRVLPLDEILDRLDDRFRLLASGNKASLPRQQTLRATMEWSFGLLLEAERTLLRRLSAFAGPWTLRAAEAIVGNDECSPIFIIRHSEVLDLLTRLVDKSLVVVETEGAGLHYRLLETVRHYAWEKVVEAGEDQWLVRRHAHWYVEFAERAAAAQNGPEEAAWFSRLDAEHDNLRAALGTLSTPAGSPLLLMRLCVALGVFSNVRGHWTEGLRWTELALVLGESAPSLLKGKAHYYAGCYAINLGRSDVAREHLTRSLELLRAEGDDAAVVRALHKLGFMLMSQGRYADARPLYEESLAIARRIDDPQSVAAASSQLAQAATDLGEFRLAARYYEESLAVYERFGNRRALALVLHNLGEVAQRLGELARAEKILRECLTVAGEVGDRHCAGFTLHVLGNVANDRGDHESAISLFREALAVHRDLVDTPGMIYVVEGMACAAAGLGDASRALRLAGAAAAARAESRSPLTPAESAYVRSYVARAEAMLGGGVDEADRLLAEGRGMSVGRALTYAFEADATLCDGT